RGRHGDGRGAQARRLPRPDARRPGAGRGRRRARGERQVHDGRGNGFRRARRRHGGHGGRYRRARRLMPRTIRIQDTLTKSLRELEPRDPGRVGIYACGPTVYARVHVGNARPYVVFSLFKRFLEHEGYDATFVANVTDVNDKIYDAAREAGVPSEELAREMTECYVEDTDRLGLGRPDHEPKASETIGPIVDLIQALIDSGHAYAAGGDVYFRVGTFPDYGKLSNRALEDIA